jgi:hypothetical protein
MTCMRDRFLFLFAILLGSAAVAAEPGASAPRPGWNKRSTPAPTPTADPFTAARELARAREISLYSYHQKYIGNTEGNFAPLVATSDGGTLLVGTDSELTDDEPYKAGKSHPLVIRLDKTGRKKWEVDLRTKGFLDFEGASAARTADGGWVVYVLSYVDPGKGATSRVVKLTDAGKIVWEWTGRGTGGPQTPFASVLQVLANGHISMKGHIYLAKGDAARNWDGELDATGTLVEDEIGEPNPSGLR